MSPPKKFLLIVCFILITIGLGVYLKASLGRASAICKEEMDKVTLKGDQKVAVLIHGYPEPIYKDTPLYKYFNERDYSIIAPYMFSSEFRLTKEDSIKYIEKILGDKKPTVIVGVSLGSLIVPYLAEKYPDAKLVLIGAGPHVWTKVSLINEAFSLKSHWSFFPMYEIIKYTPTWLYSIGYKILNHPELDTAGKQRLERHIKENWDCIKSIPEGEDEEVLNFITTVDNSNMLRLIKNKTLIFASNGDIMMPVDLSLKLRSLIKNSKLIINKSRLHWTIFENSDYKELAKFLGDRL